MYQEIMTQVKELIIREESKQLIGDLICSELFRIINSHFFSQEIKNLKVCRFDHDDESDRRVWVEVTFLIKTKELKSIHMLRPFIDTAQIRSTKDGLELRKTYFLYR